VEPTRALALALAACLVAATGCDRYTYHYGAWVRDPSAVDLFAAGAPVDASRGRSVVASGVLPTGPATSTDYTVHAERGARGSLSLSVDTRAALAYGERITLIDPAGSILYPTFAGPHFDAAGPELRLPYCASLYGIRRGYVLSAAPTCSGAALVQGELTTPRSNILRIVEVRRTNWPWVGVAGGAMAGGVLYATLVLPFALPMLDGDLGSPALGKSLLWGGAGVVTAGVVALAVMAMTTSDRDLVVYEGR
jgi:hypothetical protein